MNNRERKFREATVRAALTIGIFGIINLVYSIFLAIVFNLDVIKTLPCSTFSYTLISFYFFLILVIGTRKYDLKGRRPDLRLLILFPILIALMLIGMQVSSQAVPRGPKYALAGILSTFPVIFGLFAGLTCCYVFHKTLYGSKPLFKGY